MSFKRPLVKQQQDSHRKAYFQIDPGVAKIFEYLDKASMIGICLRVVMAQELSFLCLTLKRESIIADGTQCLTFTPQCLALGKLARTDSCEPLAKPFGKGIWNSPQRQP